MKFPELLLSVFVPQDVYVDLLSRTMRKLISFLRQLNIFFLPIAQLPKSPMYTLNLIALLHCITTSCLKLLSVGITFFFEKIMFLGSILFP